MSTRPIRAYVRDSRRRKIVLDVDLNDAPAENRNAHVDSNQHQEVNSSTVAPLPPPTIDVEAIDDEVVISSPRSFAEARSKARRNGEVRVLEVDPLVRQGDAINTYNMRRRPQPSQTIASRDCINLEGKSSAERRSVVRSPRQVQIVPPPPPPPPPPPESALSCPICMGPLVEEMTTKCGHVFCKGCIQTSLKVQSKCPTCRRKLRMKDTMRIYLPTNK